jgi:gamma-glutamylcyclotransferase (GGCT)/AIG2-like uncharacterized protein YtfP
MPQWWQDEALADNIQVALGHANYALRRRRDWETQDACGDYFDALNQLWTTLFTIPSLDESALPPEKWSSEGKRFSKLLKTVQPVDRDVLLAMSSVEALAAFEPSILDHRTPGMSQRRYEDIPEDVRARASVDHDRFKAGWTRWHQTGARSAEVLDRLCRALLVVRNNLRHGEKSRFGPDMERARRNREVSKIVRPVLKDMLDFVLDRPSQKLAIYGTLRPGQPNHHILDIDGTWLPVTLPGVINEEDGLPVFRFAPDASVDAELFLSSILPTRWQRLDEFEGSRYQRVLGLYRSDDLTGVANVYEGVDAEPKW